MLTTDRLELRPFEDRDLPFLIDLMAHAEVVKYLGGDGLPRTEEATRTWYGHMRNAYEEGLGHWLVIRRSDGQRLGRCGLWRFLVEKGPLRRATWTHDGSGPPDPELPQESVIEIGYTFHRPFWGEGHATEAARAWRDRAFETLDVESVSSFVHPENTGSARVAEKNGMTVLERIRYDPIVVDRHRIRREEWKG